VPDGDRNTAFASYHLVTVHPCSSDTDRARSFEQNLVAGADLFVGVFYTRRENASFRSEVVYLYTRRVERSCAFNRNSECAVTGRESCEMCVVGVAYDSQTRQASFYARFVQDVARTTSELVVGCCADVSAFLVFVCRAFLAM
jgi:hypothetical protein